MTQMEDEGLPCTTELWTGSGLASCRMRAVGKIGEKYIFETKELIAAIWANWTGINQKFLERRGLGRVWILLHGRVI